MSTGSKFLLAPLLFTFLLSGACSKSNDSGGEKITPEQKKQLENTNTLQADANNKAADADRKASEYEMERQALTKLYQDLRTEQSEFDARKTKIDSLQAVVDNPAVMGTKTVEEQNSIKDELAAAKAENEKLKAVIETQKVELDRRSTLLASYINSLKSIYHTSDEGRKVMAESFTSGTPYPVIAVVRNANLEQYNQLLTVLRRIDNKVRYSYFNQGAGSSNVFVFTTSKPDDLIDLSVATQGTNVNTVYAPLSSVIVKTFLNVTYAKPFKLAPGSSESILLGQSKKIEVGQNYPNISLDDVFSYTAVPESCKNLDAVCFSDLRKAGYIDGESKENDGQSVAKMISRRLDASHNARAYPPILVTSPEAITNLSLTHKVYAEVNQALVPGAQTPTALLELPYGTLTATPTQEVMRDNITFTSYLDTISKSLNERIEASNYEQAPASAPAPAQMQDSPPAEQATPHVAPAAAPPAAAPATAPAVKTPSPAQPNMPWSGNVQE